MLWNIACVIFVSVVVFFLTVTDQRDLGDGDEKLQLFLIAKLSVVSTFIRGQNLPRNKSDAGGNGRRTRCKPTGVQSTPNYCSWPICGRPAGWQIGASGTTYTHAHTSQLSQSSAGFRHRHVSDCRCFNVSSINSDIFPNLLSSSTPRPPSAAVISLTLPLSMYCKRFRQQKFVMFIRNAHNITDKKWAWYSAHCSIVYDNFYSPNSDSKQTTMIIINTNFNNF